MRVHVREGVRVAVGPRRLGAVREERRPRAGEAVPRDVLQRGRRPRAEVVEPHEALLLAGVGVAAGEAVVGGRRRRAHAQEDAAGVRIVHELLAGREVGLEHKALYMHVKCVDDGIIKLGAWLTNLEQELDVRYGGDGGRRRLRRDGLGLLRQRQRLFSLGVGGWKKRRRCHRWFIGEEMEEITPPPRGGKIPLVKGGINRKLYCTIPTCYHPCI